MRSIIALALAAQSVVLADPKMCASTNASCKVKFKNPLTNDSKFFNRFLWTADCMKMKYLKEDEEAIPFDGKLPNIPAVEIESVANLTQRFPFIEGPESIAVVEAHDVAYTGASDGYIYKIDLNTWNATKFTTACDAENVTSCRPQGIRVSPDMKKMYFADSAGLCVYDFDTGKVTVLVPRLSVVEGAPVKLPNDLDVDWDALMVYMSDGSTKYPNTNILRGTLLHENSGRVLAYNISKGEVFVLVANLSFPNGIQLSHDKQTLLVNEFNLRRILRVHLQGDNKGQYEVLTPELPGEPDNIRAGSNGTYWVAINLARRGKEMTFYDYLANSTCAITNFIKMNDLVADYLKFVGNVTQRQEYFDVANRLGSYQFISEAAAHQGNLVLINENGTIIKRYTSDNVGFFSNPVEYKGLLLVGNDRNPNITIIEGILETIGTS